MDVLFSAPLHLAKSHRLKANKTHYGIWITLVIRAINQADVIRSLRFLRLN